MAKIAYKRVSTVEQNLDRQLEGLSFDKEFIEKISGKDKNRPELANLLVYVREGDYVHVHEISRLARSLGDLKDIVNTILQKGASIKFHKENFTFEPGKAKSATEDLLFNVLTAFAQFERDLLLERQREGIAIAKQNGTYKGRQSRYSQSDIERLYLRFEDANNTGESKKKIAREFGMCESYAYQLVKKFRQEK